MPATMIQELVRPGEFPGPMIPGAVRFATRLREEWERAVRTAAGSRRLPELHETRDEYRAILESHLRLLVELKTMAELHHHADDPAAPRGDELSEALSDLRLFHDELFPRWDTLDDFFQIAIENLKVPVTRLDEIAEKHQPPQSWFEEADNPFEPA